MEKITLNYSMKSVPIPDKTTYNFKMIEKIESLLKRIDGKPVSSRTRKIQTWTKKKHLNLKHQDYLPLIPELEPFEKDLCNLVNLIKFRTNMNSFQNK